jgi:hypothetical protein
MIPFFLLSSLLLSFSFAAKKKVDKKNINYSGEQSLN